ncbi:6438_t:CDS:2 [Racocetra fulgida]|uniref:6438_t:CDS:1 n=1 Tax=Racocetra fulgida TaxID=60492 RepID=A0A9N8VM98_9GLOM|nr:6438_t:CDS:2 [Racocetra fulgida]
MITKETNNIDEFSDLKKNQETSFILMVTNIRVTSFIIIIQIEKRRIRLDGGLKEAITEVLLL